MDSGQNEINLDSVLLNVVDVGCAPMIGNHFHESVEVSDLTSDRLSAHPSVLPADITERFETIEHLLQIKDPHTAISVLAQLTLKSEAFLECGCFDSFCERLYVYFAKAYEQLKDRKNTACYLNKAINSIERRLLHRDTDQEDVAQIKRLLADLRKRYASARELENNDVGEISASWLDAAKAFEDCGSVRDAAFAALRAVRWFITATEPNTALTTLAWALKLTKLVYDKSDQGVLNNELGIAFLAFELCKDSVSCFRQALNNLEEDGTLMRASILQNLGSAYIMMKKYGNAISTLKEAASLYSQLENKAGYAQTSCNLGYALACVGAVKKARWHYTLAQRCARETCWEAVQTQSTEALTALEHHNNNRQFSMLSTLFSASTRPTLALCPSSTAHQARLRRQTLRQERLQQRRLRRHRCTCRKARRETRKQSVSTLTTALKRPLTSATTINKREVRITSPKHQSAGGDGSADVDQVLQKRKDSQKPQQLRRRSFPSAPPMLPTCQQATSSASTHPPDSEVDTLLATETLDLPPVRPPVGRDSRIVAAPVVTPTVDTLASATTKQNICVAVVEHPRSISTAGAVTPSVPMPSSDVKLQQRLETSAAEGCTALAHGDQMHNCCCATSGTDALGQQQLPDSSSRRLKQCGNNSYSCVAGAASSRKCTLPVLDSGAHLPSLPPQLPSAMSAEDTRESITSITSTINTVTACPPAPAIGISGGKIKGQETKQRKKRSRLIVPHNSFSLSSITSPKLLLFPSKPVVDLPGTATPSHITNKGLD